MTTTTSTPAKTAKQVIETLTGMVSDHNQISQHQFEMVGKAIEMLKSEPTPEQTFVILQNTSSDKTGMVGTVTAVDIETAVQKVREHLTKRGFIVEPKEEMFSDNIYFFAWFRDCGDDEKVIDLYPTKKSICHVHQENVKFSCQYWTIITWDKIGIFNI